MIKKKPGPDVDAAPQWNLSQSKHLAECFTLDSHLFEFFLCVCVLEKGALCPHRAALGRQASLTFEPEGAFDLNGHSWIRTLIIIEAILTLTDPLMSLLTPTDTVGRSRPPTNVTKISFTVYLCFLNPLNYIFGFRNCIKYRIKGNKSVNSKIEFYIMLDFFIDTPILITLSLWGLS